MTDLNFNQCLTLLIIAFVLCLIAIRCLMAVANRLFIVIDYAKEKLFGKDSGQGGQFGVKQMGGMILQAIAPSIVEGAKNLFLGKKP